MPLVKKNIKQYLLIALGTFILAAAVHFFIAPLQLVIGGVTGLAVIIYYYIEVPIWLTNLAINVPLLLISLKVLGVGLITKTVFCAVALSFFLWLLEFVPFYLEVDLLVGSVFGGIIAGFGLGLVFKYKSTTGGTTLAATLLNKAVPHIPLTKMLMFVDWSIVVFGFFVFGSINTMYAIIAIFISIRVMDFVLEGMNTAKAIIIISNESQAIGKAILKEMDRGITFLDAKGGYTGNKKDVILCVVSRREIMDLKELVSKIDPAAFVVVTEVHEVLGSGFSSPGGSGGRKK